MVNLLYVDLFCGAGGTSTGVNEARLFGVQCAKVIACVNHDPNAIASHAANHPDALHFLEDIRTLELTPLMKHVEACRKENPQASIVLWASLECTNFSRAKGGQPRDADSRTLAEHLYRYIEVINPDFIQIENVQEFMSWGPLDIYGRPVSKESGRDYLRWISRVKKYGYDYDYRVLNAADFGARTTRKRYFGMFAKKGLPIVFPEPTHSKTPKGSLKKWLPVRDVLDFDDEGSSIFDRKKPLCENTLERIYAGLVKYIAGGKDAFLVKYNSMSQRGKYLPPSLDEPCPTVATQSRLALASVHFLSKQFSGDPESKNISIEQPAGAITTVDHHAFISVHYGNGFNRSCDEPAATLTTKDRMALVQTTFLDMQYGNGIPASVDSVAGAITTNPKHHLVTVKHSHLIARMGKRPPCLVITETGELGIEIYPTDSPMTVKIKEFMALYNIIDITMRMLKISEIKLIQGFPEDYILIGTQAEQKKYLGNAVHTAIPKAWCPMLSLALHNLYLNSQVV